MSNLLPIFAEFAKIDAAQRMVFGYASTEARDRQGEIVRHAALADALPDYMKFGNIREMHQPSAVGTAKEANMDQKGLWLGAKIVDDRAWNKVQQGVYKGFSIGGRITARDQDDKSVITGLEMTEISLVDRPANPQALFEIIKRSGGRLEPQPVQKWDCGIADHQHVTKSDAATCMVHGFVKAQPNLESGKFGTHEAAAGEASAKATEHTKNAEKFRAQEGKHRANAIRARDKGDARGVGIHEHLAGAAASLARAHEQSAAQYTELAQRHTALAEKLHKAIEENGMTTTASVSEKAATDAVAALATAINLGKAAGEDHMADADEAHNMAAEHDEAAEASEAQAAVHQNEGHIDKMMTSQETGAGHRDIADGYHDLHAHHMEAGKDDEGVDNEKCAKLCKDVAGEHAADAAELEIGAKAHDTGMEKAKSTNNVALAAHHEKMAKAMRGSAAHRTELSKSLGDLHEHHMQAMTAEKRVLPDQKHYDVTQALEPKVPGQTTTSEPEKGGHGSGGNNEYSDDTSISDGFWKGGVWMGKRDFSDKERQALADKGHALPDGSFPIENKSDLHNAVQAYGRAKDKGKAKAHIKARAKDLGAEGELPDKWDEEKEDAAKSMRTATMKCGKCGAAMPMTNEKCQNCGTAMTKRDAKTAKAIKAARVAKLGTVAKGMYLIGSLASILDQIRQLQRESTIEQIYEGDDDDETPKKLETLMENLAEALQYVVTNETHELLADEDVEVAGDGAQAMMIEAAAKAQTSWSSKIAGILKAAADMKTADKATKGIFAALADKFEKLGSRHNKADKDRIQKVHDHTVELGAECQKDDAEMAAKLATSTTAQKRAEDLVSTTTKAVTGTVRDVQRLNKKITDLIATNATMAAQIKKLEASPLPSPVRGILASVRKVDDNGNDVDQLGKGAGGLFEQAMRIADPNERQRFMLNNAYVPPAVNRQR